MKSSGLSVVPSLPKNSPLDEVWCDGMVSCVCDDRRMNSNDRYHSMKGGYSQPSPGRVKRPCEGVRPLWQQSTQHAFAIAASSSMGGNREWFAGRVPSCGG